MKDREKAGMPSGVSDAGEAGGTDRDDSMPPPPIPSTSAFEKKKKKIPPEDVKLVTDLMSLFRKTLKTFTLYGDNSAAARDFFERLDSAFTETLEKLGPVSFRVDSSSLLYKGEVVLEEDDTMESYLYRLYSTGIRHLSFRPGLTSEELADFVSILSLDPNSRAMQDDDLVTLFWKKDFTNIHYVVVEGFTEAGPRDQGQEEVDFEDALSRILDVVEQELPTDRIVRAARISDEDVEASSSLAEMLDNLPESSGSTPAEVFLLTEQELLEVQAKILSRPLQADLLKTADMLIELLAWEADEAEAGSILDALLLLLDYSLSQSMFDVASRIVGGLRWITIPRRDGLSYPNAALGAAHAGLAEAANPERIRPLLASLSNDSHRDKIVAHLKALPNQAAEVLADLVADVPERVHREILCQVMVKLGKNMPEVFAARLDNHHWFVVQAMVKVLSQVGDESHLPVLFKAYEHKNPTVRAEVVDGVARFDRQEVKYFLSRALFDKDDMVRMKAIRNMAKFKGKDTAAYLLDHTKTPEFLDKDKREQREWFKTIAAVGDETIVPALEELVKARKFRKRAQYEHVRAGALLAISRIGGPAAAEALNRLAGARLSGLIRAAHTRAVQELKNKTAKGADSAANGGEER